MARRALLIGWEAADWKLLNSLLDAGALPNLQALLSRGVMGTLTAPLPLDPALAWSTLAIGRRAYGHGILCGLADDSRDGQDRPSLNQRNAPAFWDLLLTRGLKTHLVNWPLTDPAEPTGGACVSDRFFEITARATTIDPALLITPTELAQTLAPLRVDPTEVDDETLRYFVPELPRVAREHNDRLRRLARAVARTLSIQAVTTWLMEKQPWDCAVVRFDLLSDLAPWALPLAAPKSTLVGQLDFELYRHVLDNACRCLDLMLGTLVSAAGEDTFVALVSDRALLLGDERPLRSPADLKSAGRWKSREGLLVLSGRGLQEDKVIRGARAIDIAPTLLAALSVPLLPEMEGRALTEAFVEPPDLAFEALKPPWPARSTLPTLPLADDADDATIRRAWNLAQTQLDGGRVRDALALLDDLSRLRPEHLGIMQARFECQLALRKISDARETLEWILDRVWGTAQASLLQARLEYAARRFDASLRHLEKIELGEHPMPRVHLQIGLNLVKLNQSARARASFERELAIRPDSVEALAGLAYCELRAGEFDSSAEHAVEAIALNHQAYYAHFILGLAQARRGETENALAAFKAAVSLVPNFAPGHRCLAVLYGQRDGDVKLASRHKELAHASRNWSWGF